jgi:hypothetical protein
VLLRSEAVLVDQAAEQLAASEAVEVDHVGRRVLVARLNLAER